MAFDVSSARRAGYSEQEIADYLAKQHKFDAGGARKSGYTDADIIKHLQPGQPAKPPERKDDFWASFDPSNPNHITPRRVAGSIFGGEASGLSNFFGGLADFGEGITTKLGLPDAETVDKNVPWLAKLDAAVGLGPQAKKAPALGERWKPKNPNTVERFLGAAGEMAPMVGASLVDPALGAAVMGGSGAHTAHEDARAHGATPEQRTNATMGNALIQGGIGMALGPLNKFAEGLVPEISNPIASYLTKTGVAAGVNAGVGAGMAGGENLAARSFDPDRPLTQGMGESALNMALLGGGMHAVGGIPGLVSDLKGKVSSKGQAHLAEDISDHYGNLEANQSALEARRAATGRGAPTDQVDAVLEANGITPDHPNYEPFKAAVERRMAAEKAKEVSPQIIARAVKDVQEGGGLSPETAGQLQDLARAPNAAGLAMPESPATKLDNRTMGSTPTDIQSVINGQVNPGQIRAQQPAPLPDVMPVTPQGQGVTGDTGILTGQALRNPNILPVPTEPGIPRMSDVEIAQAQAQARGGNPNLAQPMGPLHAPEERLPQTPSDIESQRQAQEAFTLAEAQRGRIGEATRDTQVGGLPLGPEKIPVILDEGFPVKVVGYGAKGAYKVQRIDPRTGEFEEGSIPYEVEATRLKSSTYTPEPRRAQDFGARDNPERMSPEVPGGGGREREPTQTFRTTPPEIQENPFPGAGGPEARAPIPDQPSGPHPGRDQPAGERRQRYANEQEAQNDFRRRERERQYESYRQSDAGQEAPRQEAPASDQAAEPDAEGRYKVDDRGFVVSDKGGPILFNDQKAAAKWIIKTGQRVSPDQIFEIANYPGKNGRYTVRETGRSKAEDVKSSKDNGGSLYEVRPVDVGNKSDRIRTQAKANAIKERMNAVPPDHPSDTPFVRNAKAARRARLEQELKDVQDNTSASGQRWAVHEVGTDSPRALRTFASKAEAENFRDGLVNKARGPSSERRIHSELFDSLNRHMKGILGADRTRLILGSYLKRTPEGGVAAGSYNPMSKVIALARDIYGLSGADLTKAVKGTLNHEIVHALRDLGLLHDTEFTALFKEAARRKWSEPGKGPRDYTYLDRSRALNPDSSPTQIHEEAAAELFRHYMDNPSERPQYKPLIARVVGFFRRLTGFISEADKVMGRIASGDMAGRWALESGATEKVYSGDRDASRRDFLKGAGAAVASNLVPVKPRVESRPIDPESFKKFLRDGNIHEGLRWVMANSKNTGYRTIASKILKGGIGKTKLHVVDGVKLEEGTHVDIPSDIAEELKKDYGLLTESGDLYLVERSGETNGLDEQTLLHEALHAYMVGRYGGLRTYIDSNLSKLKESGKEVAAKDIKAYQELWKSVTDVIERDFPVLTDDSQAFLEAAIKLAKDEKSTPEEVEQFTKEANDIIKALEDVPTPIKEARSNPDEFLSYALTNPEFQDWMKKHGPDGGEIKSRSLWDEFVEWVRGIFGGAKEAHTLYDRVLEASHGLVDRATADKPDWRIASKNMKVFRRKGEEKRLDDGTAIPVEGIKINPDDPTFKEAAQTKDANRVAQWLGEHASNPLMKQLGELIAKGGVGDVSFRVVPPPENVIKFKDHPAYDGLSNDLIYALHSGRGAYQGREDHLGGDIAVVHVPDGSRPTGLTEETIAHELVHSFIAARYSTMEARAALAGKYGPIPTHGDSHIGQMLGMHKAVMDGMKARFGENFLEDEKIPGWVRAPMADTEEFLTYGLTSPHFQRLLSQMDEAGKVLDPSKPDTRTMWDKFVDWVRGVLGMSQSTDVTTMLNKVLKSGTDLLHQGRWDKPDFAYHERFATATPYEAQERSFSAGPSPDRLKTMKDFADAKRSAAKDPLGIKTPRGTPPGDGGAAAVVARYTIVNDMLAAPIHLAHSATGWAGPLRVGMPKERAIQTLDTIVSNIQDREMPVRRLIDNLRKAGASINDANDAILKMTLYPGSTAEELDGAWKSLHKPALKATIDIKAKKSDLQSIQKDTGSRFIQGLIDHSSSDPSHSLLYAYLYAAHAPERNTRILSQGRVNDDGSPMKDGSGMSNEESKAILDWFNGSPKGAAVKLAANKAYAVIAHTLEVRARSGLTPDWKQLRSDLQIEAKRATPERQAEIAKILAAMPDYKNYVPLKGWHDLNEDEDIGVPVAEMRATNGEGAPKTGAGFKIAGKEDQRAKGRETYSDDIMSNIIIQNREATIRAHKNEVAKSFVNLIRENEDMTHAYAQIKFEGPKKPIYDSRTNTIRMQRMPAYTGNQFTFVAKEGGREVVVEIKDKDLAESLMGIHSLGDGMMAAGLQILSKFVRLLSSFNTRWSLDFIVSNPPRDIQDAVTHASQYSARAALDIAPEAANVLRGLIMQDKKVYDDYHRLKQLGGYTGVWGLKDISTTLRHLQEETKTMQGNIHPLTWTWNIAKSPLRLMEALNEHAEVSTRLAVFRSFLKRGYSEERAAQLAKEMTINFNRKGKWGAEINALWMFANANIQGTQTMLQFAFSKRGAAVMGTLVGLGYLQEMLNQNTPPNEDGINPYLLIPDWEKQRNFIYMVPGLKRAEGFAGEFIRDGYVRIPKGWGLNTPHDLGRNLYLMKENKVNPWHAAHGLLNEFFSGVNPTGNDRIESMWVPTVARPIYDLATNHDWTGRQLMPDSKSEGVNTPQSQNYYSASTSDISRIVTDAASKATGGDGLYMPGAVEINPTWIDHLSGYYWGAMGNTVNRFSTLSHWVADPNLMRTQGKQLEVNQIPMVRVVIGNITDSKISQTYQDAINPYLMVNSSIDKAYKSGDNDLYAATLARYGDRYQLAGKMAEIERQRISISRDIKKIQRLPSTEMAPEVKAQLVTGMKQQQHELMVSALKTLSAEQPPSD